MKNQSEVKFTLQILRLHKIESKDLNEKQQKFFQDNLEQSLQHYLENKKQEQDSHNKFEMITQDLDTQGEVVRLVVDADNKECEYYQYRPDSSFGNVYMGDYMVILIDINRTEGHQQLEIVGLEFGLEITIETIKKKCFSSKIMLANKQNVKLVLKMKIQDMEKHLFECHLRQLVRDYRNEQTTDANGLLSTQQVPFITQADKIFKFRIAKRMPFTYVQDLYLHRQLSTNNNNKVDSDNKGDSSANISAPVFYCQLQLNNQSDNTVYFKKIDFKVSERSIFSSTLINSQLPQYQYQQQQLLLLQQQHQNQQQQQQQNQQYMLVLKPEETHNLVFKIKQLQEVSLEQIKIYLGDLFLEWNLCGTLINQVIYETNKQEQEGGWLKISTEHKKQLAYKREESIVIQLDNLEDTGRHIEVDIRQDWKPGEGLVVLGVQQQQKEYWLGPRGRLYLTVQLMPIRKGIQVMQGLLIIYAGQQVMPIQMPTFLVTSQ